MPVQDFDYPANRLQTDVRSAGTGAGVAAAAEAVSAAAEENQKDDDNPAAVASAKSGIAVHNKTLLYKNNVSEG